MKNSVKLFTNLFGSIFQGVFILLGDIIRKINPERKIKLKTVISRRAITRIISFSLAIIAVLGTSNLIYMRKLTRAERTIEYGYQDAVEELASSADKIQATLTKGLYSASPEMMTKLSGELIHESDAAKDALTRLPVSLTNLERTEKFLSQIGNYAYAMSQKASDGGSPSFEDYNRLNSLCDSARSLCDKLWAMKSGLMSNDKTITELFNELESESSQFITDGFSELESGFENTPKLIYDGPYSDHILEKVPKMIQGQPEISEDEAKEKAAPYCGVESWALQPCEHNEDGKMPSYCFYADNTNCAVTKNGGFISYVIKNRDVKSQKISAEDAAAYAQGYLDSLGIRGMEKTYYETYNNVTTVNYAYNDNGVTCYTDLIKVSVALDSGEILGFDARGFLVNHHERQLKEPKLSEQECQAKLSPMLSVVKSSLAVIPSNSVEEKLCYEFKCKTGDGRTVLVYINAETGAEEDILILLEMEESNLTV